MSGFRFAAGLCRFFVIFACCCPCLHGREKALGEYQIKALFTFNFVQFVEWPDTAFTAPDAPITIGILGDNPFGDALELATRGEKLGARSLQVVVARTPEALAHCQVVFVSRGERGGVETLLASFKGRPVLTIGETPGFAGQGGIIGFYREGDKIRFELNRSAAKQATLKLSAQLVRLAKLVGPGEGERSP